MKKYIFYLLLLLLVPIDGSAQLFNQKYDVECPSCVERLNDIQCEGCDITTKLFAGLILTPRRGKSIVLDRYFTVYVKGRKFAFTDGSGKKYVFNLSQLNGFNTRQEFIEYIQNCICNSGGGSEASFVVTAGTTPDVGDDSLGSGIVGPNDTLHVYSLGDVGFTVAPGSAIMEGYMEDIVQGLDTKTYQQIMQEVFNLAPLVDSLLTAVDTGFIRNWDDAALTSLLFPEGYSLELARGNFAIINGGTTLFDLDNTGNASIAGDWQATNYEISGTPTDPNHAIRLQDLNNLGPNNAWREIGTGNVADSTSGEAYRTPGIAIGANVLNGPIVGLNVGSYDIPYNDSTSALFRNNIEIASVTSEAGLDFKTPGFLGFRLSSSSTSFKLERASLTPYTHWEVFENGQQRWQAYEFSFDNPTPAGLISRTANGTITTTDPSLFDPPITSVNGQTGNVVLDAGDVGALEDSICTDLTATTFLYATSVTMGNTDGVFNELTVNGVDATVAPTTLTNATVGGGSLTILQATAKFVSSETTNSFQSLRFKFDMPKPTSGFNDIAIGMDLTTPSNAHSANYGWSLEAFSAGSATRAYVIHNGSQVFNFRPQSGTPYDPNDVYEIISDGVTVNWYVNGISVYSGAASIPIIGEDCISAQDQIDDNTSDIELLQIKADSFPICPDSGQYPVSNGAGGWTCIDTVPSFNPAVEQIIYNNANCPIQASPAAAAANSSLPVGGCYRLLVVDGTTNTAYYRTVSK